MDAIVEQWKVYKITSSKRWGHNVYEVSNFGRVRVNGELINFNSYKLEHGYHKVGGFKVYRAVAELFIPNPENKPCVDHINTIRTDDRVNNLRWVTYKENNNNLITRTKPNGFLHKHHSLEVKQKISRSHMGKKLSEEHKKKLSDSHKGHEPGNKGKHVHYENGKRIYY